MLLLVTTSTTWPDNMTQRSRFLTHISASLLGSSALLRMVPFVVRDDRGSLFRPAGLSSAYEPPFETRLDESDLAKLSPINPEQAIKPRDTVAIMGAQFTSAWTEARRHRTLPEFSFVAHIRDGYSVVGASSLAIIEVRTRVAHFSREHVARELRRVRADMWPLSSTDMFDVYSNTPEISRVDRVILMAVRDKLLADVHADERLVLDALAEHIPVEELRLRRDATIEYFGRDEPRDLDRADDDTRSAHALLEERITKFDKTDSLRSLLPT